MKCILLGIFISLLFFSCQRTRLEKPPKSKNEQIMVFDSTRNLLLQIKLGKYIGKTVGELLENDTIKNYEEYLWFDEPPGKLKSLGLVYSRKIYLEIDAKPLKFTQSFSTTNNFNFEDFKKEKITKLVVNDGAIERIIE